MTEVERNVVEVWRLPFKSQEFTSGPELIQTPTKTTLRLDHELPTGDYVWTSIVFQGVQGLRFTGHASCSRDQVAAYDRLVIVPSAEWLETLKELLPGTKHYRIYFDEYGCYDIAAAGVTTPEA